MNSHFYSLLMQGFLSGYKKPCEIKLPFMAIPILLYAESREHLVKANKRSRIETVLQPPQIIEESKISGKTRLSGYVDRYNSLKPYCKEAIIILSSEGKIAINNHKIVLITEWLDNELRITEKYTADFSEDVRKLKDEHSKIEEKIKEVWKQIKTIEQKFISSKALISKREKVNYAKARIALYAEMSDSGIFETVDEEIEDLKGKIASLEEKIKGFDVDKKMEKAESFLSNNMNRLSLTLDFEEEYRPIDLNFGLTDGSFDIYQHQKNNENIHLYEMGSGANWVSCHIALFLSFLRFFATQDNSPMPLFMFFDQPSQVYFPQGNDKDEITQADLMAVNKMYKTIFDEINSIGEDTERLPQIIIVDHVDGKSLKCKEEFEKYVCCNWRNNTALI